MYAVTRTWDVPGNREERIASLEEHVIPFIKTLPGFVKASFGFDVETGLGHTSLVFSDRASAQRFVEVSAPKRVGLQAEHGVSGVDDFTILDVYVEVGEPQVPAVA